MAGKRGSRGVAFEIERKFLVADPGIVRRAARPGLPMRQAYLAAGATSVRVRIAGGRGRLCVKGPSEGLRRAEFEYEVPLEDAEEMMRTLRCSGIVEKTRYRVEETGFDWEIDVFGGANAPLVLAEAELDDERREVPAAPWRGEEVSRDPRFTNAYLARHPFGTWGAAGETEPRG